MPFVGPPPSGEFLEIHNEQQEALGTKEIIPEHFFDQYFNDLLELITATLTPALAEEVKERIAVGCIDHAYVNAFIIRSEDDANFAIVLNKALVTMTNHYAKLIAAAIHPDEVIQCNGRPGTDFQKRDYIRLSGEMLRRYGATGDPVGPELKLDLGSTALSRVDSMLQAMHLFVLAHEVGHYLNGDLGDLTNFRKPLSDSGERVFGSESVSHNMEYLADEVAFEVVARVWRSKDPNYPARKALDDSVTLFFNFLREVDNRGSESHPRSSDRILAVTNCFFGRQAADVMAASFDDISQIAVFQDLLGGITVSDLMSQNHTSHKYFAT